MINRFQKIDAAIVASNANTEIATSYGTFMVAGAIALRSRFRGAGVYGGDADFEGRLQKKLASEYNERVQFCDRKNSQLQSTAEEMRLRILGKDSKIKDEKSLGVVEAYVKENTTELVDPLEVKKKMEALEEKRNTLLTELDTQIKVSTCNYGCYYREVYENGIREIYGMQGVDSISVLENMISAISDKYKKNDID